MKKQRFHDTDFLYASSRIHSAEKDMIVGEKLSRLVDTKDFKEAFAAACEMFGKDAASYKNYFLLLSEVLKEAYAFADEMVLSVTDTEEKPFFLIYPFKYIYDCQNLKACIKCEALGKDASDMITDSATVSREKLYIAMNTHDFSDFPKNLCVAAKEAIEEFSASGDPQDVDLILDKAVFEDMKECAQNTGFPYLTALVLAKTDSVNILSALRCIKAGKNKQYFSKVFVSGGKLDIDFFLSNYDENSSKLLSALAYTEYSEVSKLSENETFSISEAERICGEEYLKKALSIKNVPFGGELIPCYIVRKENEIKNVRIILAGKSCGLSAEKIRERLMMDI